MLKYVPWDWLVYIKLLFLKLIPDIFKTQEMCNKAGEVDPQTLKFVPTRLRTHKMCYRALEKYIYPMRDAPDCLKTREICEKGDEKNPYQLGDLPVLKPKGCVKKLLKRNQKP